MARPLGTQLLDELRGKLNAPDLSDGIERHLSATFSEICQANQAVNLESIAQQVGISEILVTDIPCEGMLIPGANGRSRVLISKWASRERQRFSLAHEIGHAIIHSLIPSTRQLATRSLFMQPGSEIEERLCDQIASAILLPRHSVLTHLGRSRFSVRAVLSLASRFGASLTASAIRCREVVGIDLALLRVMAIPQERLAVLQRVLVNFRRSKLRLADHAVFERGTLLGDISCSLADKSGWDWFSQGSIRRKLFVESVRLATSLEGPAVVCLTKQCPAI